MSRVLYPGLVDHPTHEIARHLLPHGCGGMLSFELRDGDQKTVSRFMQAATEIPFSPTLADPATTVSHPATTSHRTMSRGDREAAGVTDGLVRLSVGLEEPELLIRELDHAIRVGTR